MTTVAMTKPIATSAAQTAFCSHKLEGPDGHLWLDGNGKITWDNGSMEEPRPNAFSLVEIEDCPGSTPSCRTSCYVHGLKKHAPGVHALYEHNSKFIRYAIDEYGVGIIWGKKLAGYITANCQGGFRWHVSGDIFSRKYASWIAYVCQMSPTVNHWIYTRSFGAMIDPLLRVPNLAINISADRDNAQLARAYADEKRLRLCFMATNEGEIPVELRDGDVIFPDYQLRGGNQQGKTWFDALSADYKSYVCPVDYHGKTENRRCGPCPRCLFPK